MGLIAQTLGVLAAVVALTATVRRHPGRTDPAYLAAIAIAAVMTAAFFGQLERGALHLRAERGVAGLSPTPCFDANCQQFIRLDEDAAIRQVGARLNVNTPFIESLRPKLPKGARYYLAMSGAVEVAAHPQWITYRLLPALATGVQGQRGDGRIAHKSPADLRRADWIVFYGVTPKQAGIARSEYTEYQAHAPALGIARVAK